MKRTRILFSFFRSGLGHTISVVMVIVSVCLFSYVGLKYTFKGLIVSELFEHDKGIPDVSLSAPQKVGSAPLSFDEYEAFFLKSNIFEDRVASQEASGPVIEPDERSASLSDFLTNCKVVGIFLGEDPVAVVEEKQGQDTLFLEVGDRVGQAVVKEIQPGKLILILGQRRIELTL